MGGWREYLIKADACGFTPPVGCADTLPLKGRDENGVAAVFPFPPPFTGEGDHGGVEGASCALKRRNPPSVTPDRVRGDTSPAGGGGKPMFAQAAFSLPPRGEGGPKGRVGGWREYLIKADACGFTPPVGCADTLPLKGRDENGVAAVFPFPPPFTGEGDHGGVEGASCALKRRNPPSVTPDRVRGDTSPAGGGGKPMFAQAAFSLPPRGEGGPKGRVGGWREYLIKADACGFTPPVGCADTLPLKGRDENGVAAVFPFPPPFTGEGDHGGVEGASCALKRRNPPSVTPDRVRGDTSPAGGGGKPMFAQAAFSLPPRGEGGPKGRVGGWREYLIKADACGFTPPVGCADTLPLKGRDENGVAAVFPFPPPFTGEGDHGGVEGASCALKRRNPPSVTPDRVRGDTSPAGGGGKPMFAQAAFSLPPRGEGGPKGRVGGWREYLIKADACGFTPPVGCADTLPLKGRDENGVAAVFPFPPPFTGEGDHGGVEGASCALKRRNPPSVTPDRVRGDTSPAGGGGKPMFAQAAFSLPPRGEGGPKGRVGGWREYLIKADACGFTPPVGCADTLPLKGRDENGVAAVFPFPPPFTGEGDHGGVEGASCALKRRNPPSVTPDRVRGDTSPAGGGGKPMFAQAAFSLPPRGEGGPKGRVGGWREYLIKADACGFTPPVGCADTLPLKGRDENGVAAVFPFPPPFTGEGDHGGVEGASCALKRRNPPSVTPDRVRGDTSPAGGGGKPMFAQAAFSLPPRGEGGPKGRVGGWREYLIKADACGFTPPVGCADTLPLKGRDENGVAAVFPFPPPFTGEGDHGGVEGASCALKRRNPPSVTPDRVRGDTSPAGGGGKPMFAQAAFSLPPRGEGGPKGRVGGWREYLIKADACGFTPPVGCADTLPLKGRDENGVAAVFPFPPPFTGEGDHGGVEGASCALKRRNPPSVTPDRVRGDTSPAGGGGKPMFAQAAFSLPPRGEGGPKGRVGGWREYLIKADACGFTPPVGCADTLPLKGRDENGVAAVFPFPPPFTGEGDHGGVEGASCALKRRNPPSVTPDRVRGDTSPAGGGGKPMFAQAAFSLPPRGEGGPKGRVGGWREYLIKADACGFTPPVGCADTLPLKGRDENGVAAVFPFPPPLAGEGDPEGVEGAGRRRRRCNPPSVTPDRVRGDTSPASGGGKAVRPRGPPVPPPCGG